MYIDEKTNEAKKYDVNIKKPKKWELPQSIPLRYLLSVYHRLHLSNMENKTAMNEKGEKTIYQFQVGFMLNPVLNIKKAFKEKSEINMEKYFSGTTMTPVRKVLKKRNTRVISLLMFNENIKNMIFKVLSPIVYCIMENYVCVDYLCCP